MKISYEELIKKYPYLKDKITKEEWIELFEETIDETVKIFYLEE